MVFNHSMFSFLQYRLFFLLQLQRLDQRLVFINTVSMLALVQTRDCGVAVGPQSVVSSSSGMAAAAVSTKMVVVLLAAKSLGVQSHCIFNGLRITKK